MGQDSVATGRGAISCPSCVRALSQFLAIKVYFFTKYRRLAAAPSPDAQDVLVPASPQDVAI
ncbi:hypothetical protein D0469_16315 [Peribacillus saganii]|uniref:Uncharacterized protein n=1 Tax=Peribacillus saganii TaxID=2303992 RepID=A0A372LK95_9BACI|nr:hypothetical protein D0469_16315 [Peribacillus saganii]